MGSGTDPSLGYFAAAPLKDIAGRIAAKLRQSGDTSNFPDLEERRRTWGKAYKHYYGFELDGASTSEVRRTGDQGQLLSIRVNYARAVAQALIGLLTSQRITWRPTAINGEVGSRDVVDAANSTLEYLWKTGGLMRLMRHWAEMCVMEAEALVWPEMDYSRGEVGFVPGAPPEAIDGAEPSEAAPVPEFKGELRFHLVPPWLFRFDEEARSWDAVDWVALGIQRNRWTLAAMHPVDLEGNTTEGRLAGAVNHFDVDGATGELARTDPNSDYVITTEFFHKKTPSMPDGRHVVLVGDMVLVDEPLEDWDVERLVSSEQHDTAHGYTSWWDVGGAQEVLDKIESSAATNATVLGVPAVAMEQGQDKPLSRIHGLKILHVPKGGMVPQRVDLSGLPKEFFEHSDALKQTMRDVVGLTDVAMGQPDTAQMNAEAFALLASLSQQRNAPQLQEWLDAAGRLGRVVLRLVARHWPEEKQLAVTGKDNQPKYVTVRPENLLGVERVFVEVGNPLEQTAAGRLQIADLLRNHGVVMDANQIQQVIDTGRLEPIANPARDAAMFADWETDELRAGRPVVAHWADDHLAHVLNHKRVYDSPKGRGSPEAGTATDTHILEHYALYWGWPDGVSPMPGPGNPGDPQWPVRIRMMLAQQGPPMEAPPPESEGSAPVPGGPPGQPAPAGGDQLPPAVVQ